MFGIFVKKDRCYFIQCFVIQYQSFISMMFQHCNVNMNIWVVCISREIVFFCIRLTSLNLYLRAQCPFVYSWISNRLFMHPYDSIKAGNISQFIFLSLYRIQTHTAQICIYIFVKPSSIPSIFSSRVYKLDHIGLWQILGLVISSIKVMSWMLWCIR